MKRGDLIQALWLLPLVCLAANARGQGLRVVENGQPRAAVVVDTRGSAGEGPKLIRNAGRWLAESIERATGAKLAVEDTRADGPAIVVARADAHEEIARAAGMDPDQYNAYCIVTRPEAVFILGGSETAVGYGVADLLRRQGFRWFAPSPRWHIVPQRKNLSIDLQVNELPALADRRIWYAYGMSGADLAPLLTNYRRWAVANRLSTSSVVQTGHSYGNIILRNTKAFEQHAEYFALLPDGTRDNQRAPQARKFCYSHPGLIKLVLADRLRLLEEQQKINPAVKMVSVDPSDGPGTCHCEKCRQLGTTTDRVIHLANQVARGIRAQQPDAWVGLYAYSSHRLPPTIEVEPNVYVQVAMGFNHTRYTLEELVSLWSEKVGAIGLREYYGVEAWDWGLPGRMRGSQVSYHRKWIPFYGARKLNAINAETNANWGGQTLGLYVAAQLAWNPAANVDTLTDEFFRLCFGPAEPPLRRLYSRFDSSPPLRPSTLLPMFDDLQQAWQLADDDSIRRRLADLMAYLVYVAEFREFDLARGQDRQRGDVYYAALRRLMTYVWRIRHRDVVHYYALARRLCNGLPKTDNRPEFYLANRERPAIWQQGEPLSDREIQTLFEQTMAQLKASGDPTLSYSRLLEPVKVAGDDAGSSRFANHAAAGVTRFRRRLRGFLLPRAMQTVRLEIAPVSRETTLTVYRPDETKLFDQRYRLRESQTPGEIFHAAEINLPQAGQYRVVIAGDVALRVPPQTPFMFEASVLHPAWIDYSGPHYFYVPRGTRELFVDGDPRLTLFVPGENRRLDIHPAGRVPGKQYALIKVPEGADGQLWHTSAQTRGVISLLNVPPLLSFHRDTFFVPREVFQDDKLTRPAVEEPRR